MIKSLHLRNIQKHEDLLLVFVSGVNIILGDNNSGKTSCVRAIQWLALNNIPTTVMKRKDADFCGAMLLTPQGMFYRGWNTWKGNWYSIVSHGKQWKYKAPGRTVPTKVTELLRLSNINIQRATAPPFLISESPERRYEFLMEELGLTVLLKLSDMVQDKLKNSRESLKLHTLRKNLEQQKMEAIDIKAVKKREALIKRFFAVEGDIDCDEMKCDELLATLSTRKALQVAVAKETEITNKLSVIKELDKLKWSARLLLMSRDTLRNLLLSKVQHSFNVVNWQRTADGVRKALMDKIKQTKICPTCGQELKGDAVCELVDDMERM